MKILTNYNSINKDIVIYTHLGLGDMLIFHGLVRFVIAMKDVTVYVPCKDKYLDSIRFLTRDCSRIKMFRIDESLSERSQVQIFANSLELDVLLVGFNSVPAPFTYEKCHRVAHVPFSVSWDLFPNCVELEQQALAKKGFNQDLYSEPFALVFAMYSSGPIEISVQSKIRIVNVYKTEGGNGIFDWIELAHLATEIHTTASSFLHFIDRLPLSKSLGRLYLHDLRRDIQNYPEPFRTRHNWILVTSD